MATFSIHDMVVTFDSNVIPFINSITPSEITVEGYEPLYVGSGVYDYQPMVCKVGPTTINFDFDPANSVHMALYTASTTRAIAPFSIAYADTATFSWTGAVVTSWKDAGGTEKDVSKVEVTIQPKQFPVVS